jgi:hypothetical protein
VLGCHLVPLEPILIGSSDAECSPLPREVCFDGVPAEDNLVLSGEYREASGSYGRFCFTRRSILQPSYRLRLPTEWSEIRAPLLAYEVPETERLDRAYVLRALADVLG